MKKNIFLVLVGLFLINTFAYAQEMPLENMAAPVAEKHADGFGLVVSGDGKLVVKPGPLFTEGGNYKELVLPSLISNPKTISYPEWAVQQGWQGKIAVAIEILKDGSVGRYKVMHSTGHDRLDKAAVETIKGWKFHPATKDGQAIVTCVQIPITFQLAQ